MGTAVHRQGQRGHLRGGRVLVHLRQPNSRFQRALVDTGLVTAADIGYYTQRNIGPINIVAQTTPETRAAIRAIYPVRSRILTTRTISRTRA